MGVIRVYVGGYSPPSLLNMKMCDDRPLLPSNRLPEMYLNHPNSDVRHYAFMVFKALYCFFHLELPSQDPIGTGTIFIPEFTPHSMQRTENFAVKDG